MIGMRNSSKISEAWLIICLLISCAGYARAGQQKTISAQ
jgi:hypothetical protein